MTSKSSTLKTTAVSEGIPPNACEAFRDGYARQGTTVPEGRKLNVGDRFSRMERTNHQLSRGLFLTTENEGLSTRDPVGQRVRMKLLDSAEEQQNRPCKSRYEEVFHDAVKGLHAFKARGR